MSSEFAAHLRSYVSGFVELTDTQISQLQEHWLLMSQWNKRLNLTAVRDSIEAIRKHYAESLFLASCLTGFPHSSVVDIGSGAGFPGLPVAVAHPGSAVLLVESHSRKAVFLREATRDTANVSVFAGRAEHVTGTFDLAVSRAVAWGDLRTSVLRVAASVALLVGERDVRNVSTDSSFSWLQPRALPWADAGAVLIGAAVARGSGSPAGVFAPSSMTR